MKLTIARMLGYSVAVLKFIPILIITWVFLPFLFAFFAVKEIKQQVTPEVIDENKRDLFRDRLN